MIDRENEIAELLETSHCVAMTDTIQQEEFRKGASSERIAHRSSQHELRGLFLLSSFEGRATSLSTPRDLDPTFEGHLKDYCKYLEGITCYIYRSVVHSIS
jgi:hypothetical protein